MRPDEARPPIPLTDSETGLELQIESPGFSEVEPEEGVEPGRDGEHALAPCGRPRGEPKLFLHVAALDKVLDHAGGADTEVGGVLLGRHFTTHGRLATEVLAALPAPMTQAGSAHITFSHETWAAIFAEVDQSAGPAIVGWYHSHPGFGIFLSKQDVFIQENFFDGKGHMALVVDPRKHQAGAFVWREGRVVPASGFYVAAPKAKAAGARRIADLLHYRAGRQSDKSPGWLSRLFGGRSGK